MALSATSVRALKDPGRYSDREVLRLLMSKAGRKSGVLGIMIDGRRRDIGLGGYPSVSLAQARDKAGNYRAAVAEGRDPLAEKHAPAMPTFGRPPTPYTWRTRPAGAAASTSRTGCRPWNAAPCRPWAACPWTG